MNDNNQDNIYAEDLIIRFLSRKASKEDLVSLRLWLKESSLNRRQFDEICDVWLASKQIKRKNEYDTLRAWQKTLQSNSFDQHLTKSSKIKNNRFFIQWQKVAAIFIFFFVTGSVVTYLTRNKIAPTNFSAFTEHYVPYGSKSKVILPDGTKVWINSGSHLSYSQKFNTIDREVTLDGEAYFDVHKNALKPFLVKTSGVTIKVLGTAFNVKAYSDEKTIKTTVERGLVQVYTNTSLQKSVERVFLHPKEMATYIKGSIDLNVDGIEKTDKDVVSDNGKQNQVMNKVNALIVNTDVVTKLETSWKDTRWIIEREELKDLTLKIERRFNVKIDFADSKLKSYVFSGILDDESLEQVLEIIKMSAPIRYTLKQDKVTFYENKTY